jgi:hypothetical protein
MAMRLTLFDLSVAQCSDKSLEQSDLAGWLEAMLRDECAIVGPKAIRRRHKALSQAKVTAVLCCAVLRCAVLRCAVLLHSYLHTISAYYFFLQSEHQYTETELNSLVEKRMSQVRVGVGRCG